MTTKYGPSEQWRHINANQLTPDSTGRLGDFKSSPINHKLAIWDPGANGVRYLKTLVYNLAAGLDDRDWARLRRIEHRDIGEPIAVTYRGEPVCLDYLQAVRELGFITGRLDLDGRRVLEIGAGYGRTCHAIMANHELAGYVIVELANSLRLARSYLSAVLPEREFAKISFVPVERVDDALAGARFDLCLNINSFAEMDEPTVRDYLALIALTCRHLYVKNPVAKYRDKSLDGHSQGDRVVAMAMRTGLLREVIDIHDSEAVREQAKKFVTAYRPAESWVCLADDWAPPWSFYWQALYRAGTNGDEIGIH